MKESTFDNIRRIGIIVCIISLFLPMLTTTVHWYADAYFPASVSNNSVFLFFEVFTLSPIGAGATMFIAGIFISIFFRKARVLVAIGYFGISLSLWQYATILNSEMGAHSFSEVSFEYGFLVLTIGTALVLSKDIAKAMFAFSQGEDLVIVNDVH